ncbi:MAG: ATP-binding protein [Acidimicrobiia bacterium]|nr:ATP-binding protein [Acidimicrobiia bacterium]
MPDSGALQARRRLVVAAVGFAVVVVATVSTAYVLNTNLDRQHSDAVEEHLRANEMLAAVLAELTSLELYYDAVSHETDGREQAIIATFDPAASIQLMDELLTQHEATHELYAESPDERLETIEERFATLAEAVRTGMPVSEDVSEEVTWRLLNFDLATSVTQSRQWHAEAFNLEAARISEARSLLRLALLAVLLVGGLVGAVVIGRLTRILRSAVESEERARAELREHHHQLQHALAAARTASEAKTRFVANTSHELRTPLTSIIGFTEILAESGLQAEQRTHLAHIQSSADHLLQLIDDVLDISRIEAGEVTTTRDEVNVVELLQQIVRDLGSMTEGRPVELVSELPAGAGVLITDRVKLRQIVVNLVGNALKFTEEGTVTVALHVDDRGTPLQIDVIDTGIGIAPEMLEAVREPFQQADDARTRRFGGVGLGIPISLGLADLLGFEVEISSEQGAGSTFSLRLHPLLDEHQRAANVESMRPDAVVSTTPLAPAGTNRVGEARA